MYASMCEYMWSRMKNIPAAVELFRIQSRIRMDNDSHRAVELP